ncbi:tyrosine-type recombinase/integrase [Clostridium sp. MSJ-11]|uniref:Tyrosine-type recombinase/integrase n=1 Tax=Clostridium mobile TaxID=2841512 RepID=A0ABS6EN24_9CLOT|nr:site-specific tyrosine recombinase/integron integrase [Clostridium mobile]MBU5486425.1 tyrosine-type recombinase/integrase [Clostridium mobile]
MYSTTSKNEVVIKLVGKLSLEFPEIDQLRVRAITEEVLYKYDILPQETALVASDIEEKIQIYLATKRLDGLSEKTLKNYNYNLIIFANHLRKPLSTINAMDLRMYLAVRGKNLKASSLNGQISILKSFFSWLHEEEYIPRNPASKLKQTKEPKRLRNPLSEEEIELLRQACDSDREKALLEFLYSTGCRLSEVVSIDTKDINWYEMSLKVIGKGDKQRKVYFSTKAKILLKNYLTSRKDANPALFVASKYPYKRLGGRSVEREIDKIAARANIEKSIYPHIFRHSFATHKLNSGMSLPVLQALMGHENPSTTQIYAQLSQENIKHEYRKIS